MNNVDSFSMSSTFYTEQDCLVHGLFDLKKQETPLSEDNALNVVCIVNGHLDENAYLVWDSQHPDEGKSSANMD